MRESSIGAAKKGDEMRVLICSALLLTGCVPVQQYASRDDMQSTVDAYKGLNITAVVAKLGFPKGQRTMLGQTIYTWGSNVQGVVMQPVETQTFGDVDADSLSAVPVSVNYVCQIDFAVDAKNVVTDVHFSGNPAGCTPYEQALAR